MCILNYWKCPTLVWLSFPCHDTNITEFRFFETVAVFILCGNNIAKGVKRWFSKLIHFISSLAKILLQPLCPARTLRRRDAHHHHSISIIARLENFPSPLLPPKLSHSTIHRCNPCIAPFRPTNYGRKAPSSSTLCPIDHRVFIIHCHPKLSIHATYEPLNHQSKSFEVQRVQYPHLGFGFQYLKICK